MEKIRHFTIEPNLNNIYTNTTQHKVLQAKSNPSRLTTHMKTQEINNLTLSAKPKRKHTLPPPPPNNNSKYQELTIIVH